MPVVEIPEKDMVVEFPESMSPEEIERSIYADIYKQPVISQTPEPSFWEKTTGLLRGKQPTIGRRITEEDRRAFEPDVKIPRAPAKTPFQEVKEQIIADARKSLEKPITPLTERHPMIQAPPEDEERRMAPPIPIAERRKPHGVTGEFKGKPKLTWNRLYGALKEGGKDVARNLLDTLHGITATGAEAMAAAEPEGMGFIGTLGAAGKETAEEIANTVESNLLKIHPDYEVSSGFIEDLVRMAPQFGSQIAASLVGGAPAGIGMIGMQIAGGTYGNLKAQE